MEEMAEQKNMYYLFFPPSLTFDILTNFIAGNARQSSTYIPPTTEIPNWANLLTQCFHAHLPIHIPNFINASAPFEAVVCIAEKLGSVPFTSGIVEACVEKLAKITSWYNEELRVFRFALTSTTIANMHLLMVQLLLTNHLKFHSKKSQKIAKNFHEQRPLLQDYFLAQTQLQGPNMDIASVKLYGHRLTSMLLESTSHSHKRLYRERLDCFCDTVTRWKLQDKCETQLQHGGINAKVQFTKNPAKVIKDAFDKAWQAEWATIRNLVEGTSSEARNNVRKLAQWMESVNKGLQSIRDISATGLFSVPEGTEATEGLIKKQIAAACVFKSLLLGTLPSSNYVIGGLTLTLQAEPDSIKPTGSPPNQELIELLLQVVRDLTRISNLCDFALKLERELFLIAIELYEKSTNPSIRELDEGGLKAAVESKAIGCCELCPCCNRCCDETHSNYRDIEVGVGENRHKCIRGHQYQGMAGIALHSPLSPEKKYASLKLCSNMKEDDKIERKQKVYCWSDYKNLFPTWDLDIPPQESRIYAPEKRAWLVELWACVGPQICKEYLYIVGIITFFLYFYIYIHIYIFIFIFILLIFFLKYFVILFYMLFYFICYFISYVIYFYIFIFILFYMLFYFICYFILCVILFKMLFYMLLYFILYVTIFICYYILYVIIFYMLLYFICYYILYVIIFYVVIFYLFI
jgi:hypothetical protein